jgi:hypothetical protein
MPGVTLARLLLGAAVALAGLAADQLGEAMTGRAIWVLALLILPLPALPALMVCIMRMDLPLVGDLKVCDAIAMAYLVRLAVSGAIVEIRFAPSQAALVAFFAWAAVVTPAHAGTFWPLVHLVLYAAVGVGLTHSPAARRGLLWAVLGLAVYQMVVHLPHLTDRLWGSLMADPAQVGALLLAALILGPIKALPLPARILIRSLLVLGVAATQTRSIWFAFVVVLVATALPRRWYGPVTLPLVLAPIGLFVVPRLTTALDLNQESGELRAEAMSVGLRQFGEEPLTGHGWAVLDHLNGGIVYNLWVHVGVATGLVGILLFLGYILLLSVETSRTDGSAYLFLTAVLAISLTETPLYGGSMLTLLFFTVISSAAPRRPSGEERPQAVPGISRPGHPSSLGAPPHAHGWTAEPVGPDHAGAAPAPPGIPQESRR